MKIPFRLPSRPFRLVGVAFVLAICVFGLGAPMAPAAGAATATVVPVDQQPLTLQPSIPPNIMLMVDDSGSMGWSVMPDYGDLADKSVGGMRNSAVNGVYYDPTVTYLAPPKADSTAAVPDMYPNNATSSFPNAWNDPLNGSASTQDVTHAFGYASSNPMVVLLFFDSFYKQCDANGNCGNYQLDTTGVCTNPTNGANCISAFAYTTGSASAGYVTHYVASSCTNIPSTNCVNATDTSSPSAPPGVSAGQNVMNWYSYYSSRIKMARSGLMTAFSGVNTSFRVGFGSINGTAASWISSNMANNTYPFATPTQPANVMAEVQPFGNGMAGTQKASFWQWVAQLNPAGHTPLRAALDAVGKYYSGNDSTTPASNAWDMMSSDPGYVAGGSNTTQIACRQAYTILTTDGFWNQDFSGVGNADGTAGSTITNPNGKSYTYAPVGPYSDTYSDTLADVAMHYWQTDLQPGMLNEVPTSTSDPAFWQHMVTFTLGLGYTPTGITGTAPNGDTLPTTQDIFNWANDGGGPNSKYAINNFAWPQPAGNSINNIADLEHAGVNGHGGFFSATSPQAFVNGLQAALKRATERVGTGASLAANSTQLTTGTVIYQANYYTSTWKGDLKAFAVNAVNGAIAPSPTWQASSQMPSAASRNIQTWNGSAFVAFKNGSGAPPTLSAAQNTALGGGTTGSSTAEQNMVNYLRGDPSQEQQNGGTLRSRDWVLGDIVDSQPVYSGPPDPNEFVNQGFYGTVVDTTTNTVPFYTWAVGTTDSSGTFTASAASTRTPLIFVAANDGMLHAFNAQTGVETFAYLPGAVITAGLAKISDPAYGSVADPHQFYNDGQLTVADAYIDTKDGNGQSWHTILVGTTGRGTAEAVYALDVTDPNNIKPLWERSAGDNNADGNSKYIGQMVGKPVIAQTNATTTSSTWSVLIGNGYNSAAGVSALLQFNLANGTLNVHTTTDTTTGNGLAAPVAWMDNPGNGVSDVAYAGDLHGQVWSFQLNDTTGAKPTPTSTGSLLFTAKDASGKVQPITAGMLAGNDPSTHNVWLYFGTGQYLSSTDLANRDTQTWYGIIVQSATKNLVSNLSNGRSALKQRTITAQTSGGSSGLPARTVSTQTVNTDGTTDMTGKSGWYMDLLAPINGSSVPQGERMVDPNEFQGSLLIGVTRIPVVTDVCNPSGSGWIMALNPFTGTAPSADFFDVNNDGYVNGGDQVGGQHAAGVGFGSLPNAPIFVGGIMETSFDNGTTSTLKTAGTVGTMQRVNWDELVNP
jgi:type IV pilus assembly protein PilY1